MSVAERPRGALALLLASFALFGCLYAVWVPAFEGPDEPQNFQYLDFIATEGKLVTPTLELTHEMENLGRGIMPPLWFLVHLPVYHVLGMEAWEPAPVLNPEFLRHPDAVASFAERGLDLDAALALPNTRLHYLHGTDEGVRGSDAVTDLVWLRMTGVFWGVLALYFSFRALRLLFECERRALWFTALLAWTPQLQFISANVNMDAMLAASGAFFFWAALEWLRAPGRAIGWAIATGAAVGVAAHVKLNGLVLGVPLVLALVLRARSRSLAVVSQAPATRAMPLPSGSRRRESLAAALACAVSLAPYYLHGLVRTGHPLWMWAYQKASPLHNPPGQAEAVWDLEGLWNYHLGLFLTWFADIGWASVWFPSWIALPVLLIFALGGAFGLVLCVRALTRGGSFSTRPGLALVLGAFLAIFAAEFYFNSSIPQPQGRHLYPFLPVLLVPLGLGLERLHLLKPFAVLSLVLSVAAFPLLVDRLRPEGWNERSWVAVTDEGRVPVRDLADAEPTVQWSSAMLDPTIAPGQPFHTDLEGGLLAWEARPGHTYELLLGVNNPGFEDAPWRPGVRLLRSSVTFGVPLAGTALLPPDFLASLPAGTELVFQVVELDAEGRTTGFSAPLTARR